MTADEPRASALARGWWWAQDYVYAAVRQAAILATPWRLGRPRPVPRAWREGSTALAEIILLPGVYEHWTFLRPLGDALNAAGHRVSVVHGLGMNRRGVAETSARLGRALAARPAGPAGRVIVAHSKGGLIGKHLLVSSGTADAIDLLGLVAVCAPFHGSPLAALFLVPSIRAFLPEDETIVMLGRDESVNARIVSVFGRFDPHIPGGSALDGATNVIVPAQGHFRILGSTKTHAAVLDGVRMLSVA